MMVVVPPLEMEAHYKQLSRYIREEWALDMWSTETCLDLDIARTTEASPEGTTE